MPTKMMIVGQNGKVVVNTDNCIAIETHGRYIHAHSVYSSSTIPLGVFETEERTQEVFNAIVGNLTTSVRVCYIPEE